MRDLLKREPAAEIPSEARDPFLLVKASMVGASAMVGGRPLSKAAEAKCEHGATLRGRNDFYFLLRLAEESEKN